MYVCVCVRVFACVCVCVCLLLTRLSIQTADALISLRFTCASADTRRLLGDSLVHTLSHCIVSAHQRWRAIPARDRVAVLPPQAPNPDLFDWSIALVVSSSVPGAVDRPWNLFNHGWLMERELSADPDRKGIQKWPLIGLFDCTGFGPGGPVEDVSTIGVNEMRPADQHAHLVEETMCAHTHTHTHT